MRSLLQAVLVLVALSLPFAARADTLGLSPASGSFVVGKTFPVTVYVTSTSQAINAVSGTLSYPADKLQVVSVSKTGSILTLWVSDPSFSNGTISFEGVVPNPGFQGSGGRLITVNFKVIGSGSATVKWTGGSELANDGSGTNILKNLNNATYTLGAGTEPQLIAPTVESPVSGGIKITSDNFPDSSKWYSIDHGTFSWTITDSITSVRVLLGRQPDSVPTVVYDPPIDTKKLDNIDDGVWYFHLQEKDAASWGNVTHYQFRVDTTPPESMSVKIGAISDPTNPRPRFIISASDATSGVDHYTFKLDDAADIIWRDDGSGVWQPNPIPPGSHTLLAKAYDEAGNSTPASVDFHIDPIDGPKITYFTDRVSDGGSVVVRGTVTPGNRVAVNLKKSSFLSSDEGQTQTVDSDDSGAWSAAINVSKLDNGAYNLTAVAVDSRGARSEPTAGKTVLIGAAWYQSLGSTLLKILAFAVPILALILLLVIVFLHGFNRIKMTNRRYRASLHNVEDLVDQSFTLLKEDVEDSIRLLERTKTKRKLTAEEDAIIDRFRQNLRDAEKVIHNEMRKIEKQI